MKIGEIECDKFTVAYMVAALWSSNDSSTPEGGEPLDSNYDVHDFHPEAIAKIVADCKKFQEDNAHLLIEDNCFHVGCPMIEYADHDFFLTRNHHGCGYWEGSDWEVEAGALLTKSAQSFGECNIVIGDDGKLYQE